MVEINEGVIQQTTNKRTHKEKILSRKDETSDYCNKQI